MANVPALRDGERQDTGKLLPFRRAMDGFIRAWKEVQGTARMAITGEVRSNLPDEDLSVLKKRMQNCLNPKGGEVTARALTADLGKTYLRLTEDGRHKFLKLLASEFDLDRKALEKRMQAVMESKDKKTRAMQESKLRDALVSPRVTLLKQFNTLPDGFKFLVDLRADLMGLQDPELDGLEADLKSILTAWFDIGLLDMEEITWRSPAALLEKLIAYEAVHKIVSWNDLKNRLDSDRRVFAFFHNKMPLEPLIFVQVALVKGMSDSIQALLDETAAPLDVAEADTAIFYSISNAQKGLAGISFGNFLIKRVVGRLTREMKQIKTFATLSPVPGFRAWLDPKLKEGDEKIFEPAEIKLLQSMGKEKNAAKALHALLESDWVEKSGEALKPMLMRLAAHYLIREKKNEKALDPVAHFHLTNGAWLERVNWLGDTSKKGMKQSAGIMVNYHYKLGDIDENHEDYVTEGKIAAARQAKSWLK